MGQKQTAYIAVVYVVIDFIINYYFHDFSPWVYPISQLPWVYTGYKLVLKD